MSHEEHKTFHQFFGSVCGRVQQQLALSVGGDRYTYRDLWEKSGTLALAFLKAGVNLGDRIGLWLPNGVEYILSLLAAARVGAISVPLNTRFPKFLCTGCEKQF